MRGEGGVEHATLELDAGPQRQLEGGVDRLLRHHRDRQGHRRDRRRGGERVIEQAVARHDAGDKARALGLDGVDRSPGEDQLHRLRLADRAGEALGSTHPRYDPELDLRLAELRGFAGEDEVAHQRELAAAAERVAGHSGDERGANGGERCPPGEPVGEVHVDERLRCHLLDVGASGERAGRPGDDDRADPGVGVESLGCGDDIRHHCDAQGVQRLWAVERDQPHPIALLDEDGVISSHAVTVPLEPVPFEAARIVLMIAEKSWPAPPSSANRR